MSVDMRQLLQEQMADKLAKGEALRDALKRVTTAQTALETATKQVTVARKDAIAAGWSEAELKRLGLTAAAPTRTRRRAGTDHGDPAEHGSAPPGE